MKGQFLLLKHLINFLLTFTSQLYRNIIVTTEQIVCRCIRYTFIMSSFHFIVLICYIWISRAIWHAVCLVDWRLDLTMGMAVWAYVSIVYGIRYQATGIGIRQKSNLIYLTTLFLHQACSIQQIYFYSDVCCMADPLTTQ